MKDRGLCGFLWDLMESSRILPEAHRTLDNLVELWTTFHHLLWAVQNIFDVFFL